MKVVDKIKRLHFEDDGQDFLWWDVDEKEVVVDCGPFQASFWVGAQLIKDSESGLVEGDCPVFISKAGEIFQLLYKVEKIEEMEVSNA